jgi:hypothetical protein
MCVCFMWTPEVCNAWSVFILCSHGCWSVAEDLHGNAQGNGMCLLHALYLAGLAAPCVAVYRWHGPS